MAHVCSRSNFLLRKLLMKYCRQRLPTQSVLRLQWNRSNSDVGKASGDTVSALLEAVSKRTRNSKLTSNFTDSSTRVLLSELRQQIDAALSVRRSHEQGNLFPKVFAERVAEQYKFLRNDVESKAAFFELLVTMGSRSHQEIQENCQQVLSAKTKGVDATCRAEGRLRLSLIPIHQYLFVELGKLNGGVELLVDMRKDFLDLKKQGMFNLNSPDVRLFDDTLKTNLAQWFGVGFLDLQRMTWQSPADLLEKIADNERVHEINGLDDVKRRVGPMRRCFIYTHYLLPGEPLVILHIALGNGLESNIQDIINEEPDAIENDDTIYAATFYSISSTNQGLAGIDLGNLLIKTVVQKLKEEFRLIDTFGTLSPIPGFRKWLTTKLASISDEHDEDVLPMALQDIDMTDIKDMYNCEDYLSCLAKLKVILNDGSWSSKPRLADLIETPMLQLCARYLCEEKRRRSALDPVANFHLSNGAMVWRINWMANISKNGMATSHGLMVNYKYDLDNLLINNHNYIMQSEVTMSDQVASLLTRSKWGNS